VRACVNEYTFLRSSVYFLKKAHNYANFKKSEINFGIQIKNKIKFEIRNETTKNAIIFNKQRNGQFTLS
jgi:hypothetical protein